MQADAISAIQASRQATTRGEWPERPHGETATAEEGAQGAYSQDLDEETVEEEEVEGLVNERHPTPGSRRRRPRTATSG
eukprot:8430493-Alexandrium_andersonii.AAC.1